MYIIIQGCIQFHKTLNSSLTLFLNLYFFPKDPIPFSPFDILLNSHNLTGKKIILNVISMKCYFILFPRISSGIFHITGKYGIMISKYHFVILLNPYYSVTQSLSNNLLGDVVLESYRYMVMKTAFQTKFMKNIQCYSNVSMHFRIML